MTTDVQAIVNTPENPIVQIDRAMFTRIEEQQQRVGETSTRLIRATNEHKDAKKAHDSATETLNGLIAAMVRKVNGISDHAPTPLFDNMSEAIDAANSDPVVQKLLNRMIDHGISHLNALVVAGYDEAQRADLAAYLDALDLQLKAETARANAEAEGQTEGLPEAPPAPEVPAFLVPQEPEPIPDAHVIEALSHRNIELKKKHIALMTREQRAAVLAWDAQCHEVQTRLGEAVTFDDLPAPPSFVLNPKELEPADTDDTPDRGEAADTDATAQVQKPKKARAPRRSSSTFRNSPKLAGNVHKISDRKRGKAARS
jgi:hypothetical protein